MAGTYINLGTFSANNNKKFTISTWIKRSKIAYEQLIYYAGASGANGAFRLESDDKLRFYNYAGSMNGDLKTTRKLRDTHGWYHLVLAVDTTQATAANRVKIYINGTQETAFDTEDYPSQNAGMYINNSSDTQYIGTADAGSNNFDGLMSHFYFIDNTQYAASDFGSTDATTGEWKLGGFGGTYGTNGFYLKMEDSSNMDLDSSGNGHSFTTTGNLKLSQDCPSNVFATINPLQVEGGGSPALTFANGNTKVTRSGNWRGHMSSIGVNKGKWYWEVKCTGNIALGIAKFGGDADSWAYLAGGQSWLGDKNDVWILYNNASSQVKYTGASSGGNWGTVTGDAEIVMIAFDADNGIIWTGNGGTWHESATEAEIEAGTTTNAMYSGITIGNDHFGSVGAVENGNLEYNFGDGFFGTTAVSSAGTNASGLGIFEYDVPDGFTALCTKGLNE
jgi:hypothetical protein